MQTGLRCHRDALKPGGGVGGIDGAVHAVGVAGTLASGCYGNANAFHSLRKLQE